MKLIFAFTNGSKFDLNLPAKLNRKSLIGQLMAFQAFCLASMVDHKRYASGKTTFKIPTHRPCFIGLQLEDGKVVPITDNAGSLARIKGYSVITRTGKGKDAEFTANPDFGRFIWSKVATLVGVPADINVLTGAVPVLESVDVPQLTEGKAKVKATRQVVNA